MLTNIFMFANLLRGVTLFQGEYVQMKRIRRCEIYAFIGFACAARRDNLVHLWLRSSQANYLDKLAVKFEY